MSKRILLNLLFSRIKELKQEIRMLRRINANLKRELRENKRGYRINRKWSKGLKNTIIQLRDVQKKDFSDIALILSLSNRESRNLYNSAKSQRN